MEYDPGPGDDDMNRGSNQTRACCGERGSPYARVDGLRVCDKRSETGQREEVKEGGRKGAKGRGRRGGRQGWTS